MMEFKDRSGPAAFPRPAIRRSVVIVLLLAAAVVVAVIDIKLPAILATVARLWVVSDALEPADAIVVLGGGVDTRPAAAARLYRGGFASQILVSASGVRRAGPGPGPGAGAADEDDRDALIKLGVPTDAVKEFGDNPANTYEEARALAHWAEQNRARRIIVPTEIFTSRRVAWIFRRELGRVGVQVMIEAVGRGYNVGDWWRHDGDRIDFESEAIKYLYYRMRYWRD